MSFMEMTKIQFVVADKSHAGELSTLINSAYRGDSSKKGWTTEADLLGGQRTDPEKIQELIEALDSYILMAVEEKTILGCVYLAKKASEAYLGMLTIDPELQAGGLGKKLMAEAESFVQKKWQSKGVHMTVITLRNELIAWYERRGYHRTGQFENFPYGDARFGLPKREDLRFEVLRKLF